MKPAPIKDIRLCSTYRQILILGTYYVVLFVGHFKQNKTALIVGTGLQAIATLILIGLFVFFVVEIFVPHSLIYQVLTYIKNTEESRRVRIARNTSIAMAVDSLITAGLHFWALTMCFLECRQHQNIVDKPFEALAIHTELDVPECSLPRLRTNSAGEIVGTMRSTALFEHHRSMPPPTRY